VARRPLVLATTGPPISLSVDSGGRPVLPRNVFFLLPLSARGITVDLPGGRPVTGDPERGSRPITPQGSSRSWLTSTYPA
jgi:hypothetical protein